MGMLQPGGELDLPEEPVGAEHGGQLRVEHLERDRAVVLPVVGQEDRGHATPTQLPLEAVAVGQSSLKLVLQIGQGPSIEGDETRIRQRQTVSQSIPYPIRWHWLGPANIINWLYSSHDAISHCATACEQPLQTGKRSTHYRLVLLDSRAGEHRT